MLSFYTTVAVNNKGGRIWIEGTSLRNAGFKPNSRYRVEYKDDSVTLRVSKKGERSVSKRTRSSETYPIIDINNKGVLDIFPEKCPIVCDVQKGVITISIHHIRENQTKREAQLLNKVQNGIALTESALCVGGGISTHAIHSALKKNNVKSKVDSIAELDVSYAQIAQRNLSPNTMHIGKIEDIDFNKVSNTDILSFSLPCTGHSPQGKTKNAIKSAEEHKEAATSIFGAINYIVKSNPAYIISENVIQAQDSATYILLKAEIRRLGYEIQEYILDHNQAGTIEKRKRYWFVATSKGIYKKAGALPKEAPVYKKKYKSIKSILSPREEETWMPEDYFNKRLKAHKSAGRGFTTAFVTSRDEFTNVIPRNYTKRQISNPHFHVKGKGIRLFNPEEHCKIKGIPTKLVSGVSDTKAHEILGQSVSYNQAYAMGEIISKSIAVFISKKKGE